MNNEATITCKKCRKGLMRPIERTEAFHPPEGEVVVMTLAAKCDHCGSERVLGSQMEENFARLRARKAQYGRHLLGEEILEFRRKYGLSQTATSQIFGKGKIAFSRYENEKTFPDESTTKLLEMAMQFPQVLKTLADKEGVEIPLWDLRVEDEKAQKLRNFTAVPKLRHAQERPVYSGEFTSTHDFQNSGFEAAIA